MLTVWEAIQTRRSIRRFSSDNVPDELIEQMLEAARLAPSGGNRQPWCFLVVKDISIKRELRRICLDQHFIEQVPVVIVCFANLDRYSLESRRKRRQEQRNSGVTSTLSGRFADPQYLAYLDSQPSPPYDELTTTVVANTYIAIEHLVLMATALGLGTCWVGAFDDPSEINGLFGLGDNLLPIIVLPVGYPAEKLPPQRPRLNLEEILLNLHSHT